MAGGEPAYSPKYYDDTYEYRHGDYKLMSEDEWRAMGVRQSPGWEHYAVHKPEPYILLFRRRRNSPEAIQSAQYQRRLAEAQVHSAPNGVGCK